MDGNYQLLAARYVRKQVRQLTGQFDGVRKADDIEFIHRVRVASRRLRAGMRIFRDCFPRKRLKRWRKQLRRLTDGLGPARDRDVQIEFVRSVLSGLNDRAHRPGIARLLLRLEQGRQALQPRVVKAVDRLQATRVPREMLRTAKQMLSGSKRRKLALQSPFVFRQAEQHICGRLNRLTRYEDCLADPQDIGQHHAMRIAGKRLRYTMEVFQPVYEGRLDESVAAVKELQLLLGEVHDCDVWVEHLEKFLEEERERTVAYYGHTRPFARLRVGLEHLRREREARRRHVFGRLVDYWQQLNQRGLWEELVRTVQSPAEPSVALPLSAGASAPKPKRRLVFPR